jgi:hypothetical protein
MMNELQFNIVKLKGDLSGTITCTAMRPLSSFKVMCELILAMARFISQAAKCWCPKASNISRSLKKRVQMLLIEPRGVVTGHAGGGAKRLPRWRAHPFGVNTGLVITSNRPPLNFMSPSISHAFSVR